MPDFPFKNSHRCAGQTNMLSLLHSTLGSCIHITQISLPERLAPEDDEYGNIEYKRTLSGCSDRKMQSRATQMLWRLHQSEDSTAIYYLGVEDCGRVSGIPIDEMQKTITVMSRICSHINAEIVSIGVFDFEVGESAPKVSCCVKVLLRDRREVDYEF